MKIALIVLIAVLLAVGVASVLITAGWTVDDPNLYVNWDLDIQAKDNGDDSYNAYLQNLNGTSVRMTVKSQALLEEMGSLQVFAVSQDHWGRVVEVRSAREMGYTWAARDLYVKDWGGEQLVLTPDVQLKEAETVLQLSSARICRTGDFDLGRALEKYDKVCVLTHAQKDAIIFPCERLYGKYDFCQGCKKEVFWKQWLRSGSMPDEAGHYYLVDHVKTDDEVRLSADICLDTAGYSVTQTAPGKNIYALDGCSFTLMNSQEDRGVITPGGGDGGSCFYVGQTASLRIFGGTLSAGDVSGSQGLCIVNEGSVTLDGGRLLGGTVSGEGGAVYNAGDFHMLGGQITGGQAQSGGCILNQGSFIMTGGTVSGGKAHTAGGCLGNAGEATITGGRIAGGTAPVGANIYVHRDGALTLTEGMQVEHIGYEE